MKTTFLFKKPETFSEWEYVLKDYLDLGCSMKEEDQNFLIQDLRNEKIQATEITMHQAFSISNYLVIITKNVFSKECWLYQPQKKMLRKKTIFSV